VAKFKKPMLAVNETPDWDDVEWPMFASRKLDGMRAIVLRGKLLSRSMKEIPNVHLLGELDDMLEYSLRNEVVFDGELYSHEDTFQKIISVCRSKSHDVPDGLKFNAIDMLPLEQWDMDKPTITFRDSNKAMIKVFVRQNFKKAANIVQYRVASVGRAKEMLAGYLDTGYEGMMLRDPEQSYKHGRTTANENWLFKFKSWLEYDGKITGVIEGTEMIEGLKRKVGPTGHREPIFKKGERRKNGTFGKFVIELEDGTTTKCGNWKGLTNELRNEIWKNQDQYIGRWVRFKGQAVGVKDKPRISKDFEFRDDKD
jgi:DNA ligase 1